jgi:hypothetical protein
MKILVAGGFDKDEKVSGDCIAFCQALGREVVRQGHAILGGCQTLLDKTVAGAATAELRESGAGDSVIEDRVVSYVNRETTPAHEHGRVLRSKLASWDFTSDDVYVPEPIGLADAVVLVRGWEGTQRAANWARYAGKPLLPVAAFGSASEKIFEKERLVVDSRYGRNVTTAEYDILGQHTTNWETLAKSVVSLAERITTSRTIFVVMSFSDNPELEDAYDSIKEVCAEVGYRAMRVDESNKEERITPMIEQGIRDAAFVIADVTEERPNVYYELGLADGFGKRKVVSAREGTTVHFDLFDVPILYWRNQKQLKENLRDRLREFKQHPGAPGMSDAGGPPR